MKRAWLGHWVLLFISFIFSIALCEGLVRVFTHWKILPYANFDASPISDEVLHSRLTPHFSKDIDDNGFRNAEALDSASIVALGDSTTFGWNEPSSASWPSQLQKITKFSVYNMGMGGYGPSDYFHLSKLAKKMNPDRIVVCIYMGNDIADSKLSFRKPFWKNYAHTEGIDITPLTRYFESGIEPEPTSSLSRKFLGRLELFQLLRSVPLLQRIYSFRRDRDLALAEPDWYFSFSNSDFSTTINLRELTNLTQQFGEGRLPFVLTQHFMKKIQEVLGSSKLLFVFLPTKATVFAPYLKQNSYQIPPNYIHLLEEEVRAINEFTAFSTQLGVHSLDLSKALQTKILSGEELYRSDADVHPNAKGNLAIAEAIAIELKK